MSALTARILLWGIEGAGKSATLETIHAKLQTDLRGELRREPSRLDPTVHYETLPISLGEVHGVETQIELVATPGAPDQAMTRKQLLDEVDGVILTLDCSPERIEANHEAIEELRASLGAYGRELETLPVVLQYNKRDIADPFSIEALHRRIELDRAAVFETIATTGHGILPTLTTIAKRVVRARREVRQDPDPQDAAGAEENFEAVEIPGVETDLAVDDGGEPESMAHILESAILAEGEAEGYPTLAAIENEKSEASLGPDLRVVSVGEASIDVDGGVRLPLVLGDAQGGSRSVILSLRLDGISDAAPDGAN